MTLDKWEDSNFLRVENKSVLVDGIDDLGKNALIYKGLIPAENPQFSCARPLNKEIRIPARFSAYALYHYVNVVSTPDTRFTNDEKSTNGFYGYIFSSSDIYNKSEILSYVPRLYVQLQKLSEFIADIGLNYHFHEEPIFNTPTASYSYGYKFNRVTDIPDDAYILRAYSIYTNTTDGNNQTLLCSYDYTTKTNNMPALYDTFIPCDILGYYAGTAFIPYMRSLLPHYYLGNQATRFRYTAPLYAGINGIIGFGKISGAINMASFSGSEDFSKNPFMNTVIASYYPDYWATLTTAPTGEGIYYIAADLSTWKQLFTASGMPWTDNIDDVIKPDDDDLNKPTTPGLPSNPVIDDDGPGSNISDPVDYPDPPYVPNSTVYDRYFLSPTQIPAIKDFLFSDTFIDNIKRLWTNPAEYVISLVCYPFDVENTNLVTSTDVVSIGGISSNITAAALADRGAPYFYGGSVFVDNYYNSYLDYEPYTSIDIYIPYIGVRPLNVSQIVGHTLCIGYYIDLNTQQITALLGLDGQNGNLGQVLTQYVGSIGVQAPLSGVSAQDMIRNVVTQTAGLVTGIGAIAGGAASYNPSVVASGISSTAVALLGGKNTSPSYYGSLSPISGLFTPQIAYLIINRPRQAIPASYSAQMGFSSCYSGKVSQFSGYLECSSVDLISSGTMTWQEQQEINNLLIGGIYI